MHRQKRRRNPALVRVLNDAKEILEKAKVLLPLLQKGAVCAGGTCEPKIEEEGAEPQVVCYELSDGKLPLLHHSPPQQNVIKCLFNDVLKVEISID